MTQWAAQSPTYSATIAFIVFAFLSFVSLTQSRTPISVRWVFVMLSSLFRKAEHSEQLNHQLAVPWLLLPSLSSQVFSGSPRVKVGPQFNCKQFWHIVGDSKNDDVNLYQGKWWWAAMVTTAASQVWNYSLPPTAAPSLICLNQGMATASPSCLGGGWSSVGDGMDIVVTTLTLAALGLQAMPAGLSFTLWGAF